MTIWGLDWVWVVECQVWGGPGMDWVGSGLVHYQFDFSNEFGSGQSCPSKKMHKSIRFMLRVSKFNCFSQFGLDYFRLQVN